MSDTETFALIILVTAAAALVAVLSNRISQRIRIPAPLIFLVVAAVCSDLVPALSGLSIHAVQRLVTLALAIILFDGGMHIGAHRFRSAAGAVVWIGVVGTFVTAAALAALAHYAFGFGWLVAMLLGTALSPTDPAVVFSVLGSREVTGRAGTILEGESGANDPVGIALMLVLLTATGGGLHVVAEGVGEFALQMVVGAAIGVAGGRALLAFMRKVPLPSAGLYPLRTLAGGLLLYGVATVAHGSGFLAVFVAGILLGDERAPYKADIERFHGALASLGEIVAFVVLGLTVDLTTLNQHSSWLIGLAIGALLAFVVRPLLVGAISMPIRLTDGERLFVLFSGLKGAVPILLGTYILTAGVDQRHEIYDVIFVVVAFSVLVQGSLVPTVARRLGVPMRILEPEPYAVGVRLRDEPESLRRFVVAAGSPADGCTIRDLDVGENSWISLVTRAGRLLPVTGRAQLQAGDEVVMLGGSGEAAGGEGETADAGTTSPDRLFTRPA